MTQHDISFASGGGRPFTPHSSDDGEESTITTIIPPVVSLDGVPTTNRTPLPPPRPELGQTVERPTGRTITVLSAVCAILLFFLGFGCGRLTVWETDKAVYHVQCPCPTESNPLHSSLSPLSKTEVVDAVDEALNNRAIEKLIIDTLHEATSVSFPMDEIKQGLGEAIADNSKRGEAAVVATLKASQEDLKEAMVALLKSDREALGQAIVQELKEEHGSLQGAIIDKIAAVHDAIVDTLKTEREPHCDIHEQSVHSAESNNDTPHNKGSEHEPDKGDYKISWISALTWGKVLTFVAHLICVASIPESVLAFLSDHNRGERLGIALLFSGIFFVFFLLSLNFLSPCNHCFALALLGTIGNVSSTIWAFEPRGPPPAGILLVMVVCGVAGAFVLLEWASYFGIDDEGCREEISLFGVIMALTFNSGMAITVRGF